MTVDPVDTFRTEAADLLEQVEQGLLDLMQRLDDDELVNAVFRGLHTLKGSGAMFGFDALAAFTHHCETAFDRVRRGEAPATVALARAVLDACDHMRALVDSPGAPGQQARGRALLDALGQAVAGAGGGAAGDAGAPAATGWHLRFSLPADAMAKGTNPLALLKELRALGDARVRADIAMIPPLEALDPLALHLAWEVDLTTTAPRAAVDDVFIFVMDTMELHVEPLPEQDPARPAQAAPPAPGPATTGDADIAAPADASAQRWSRPDENVRVPAARLDELMDRVGELVIAQSRLGQLANARDDLPLRAVSEEMERLSGELRDTMMVLRMVPVGSLFARFRRLVHDLALDTGKPVELVTDGENTEVDKTVIERLADPLVHLVRNAADHGIEAPESRTAAGKPATGRIRLSARQEGGEVIIAITDDGAGIDRARVRARAEEAGLIAPGQALADAELLQLVLEPGFSTAARVTSLSGRGVGMDVVKRTIDSLRGGIDITSTPGEGTRIALRIPLTVAIIGGLLVRVGQGRYVIPLATVEECLELPHERDNRSRGRAFVSLRDRLVPFLRLRELFATGTSPDPHQKMVVVSTGTERVGLVVDQIIGNHQTVIKSLSRLHAGITTFSGATILGDGSVALILDVAHLVASGQQQEAQLRAAG
ncbi:MAG: chemotaxis protein CheA [Rubellimicrobium sp.]|nr:chemotaxis protein CheA [Rubellimicrobium sp.]